MFDLFRSREKSVRILLGALLLVVALSMLAYLIPGGPATSMGTSSANVIAEVGDQKVTIQDIDRSLNSLKQGRAVPPSLLAQYVPAIVNQLVWEKALAYKASEIGITVSDQEIADLIQEQFGQGKTLDPATYQAMVAQQGQTVPQFETNLRAMYLSLRLQALAMQSVIVSDAEAKAEYERQNQKIGLEYVKLPQASFVPKVNRDPALVKAYFDANRGLFVTREKRSGDILVGSVSEFIQGAKLSDDDLKKLYQMNIDSYRVPERAYVRHILVMTQGKPKEQTEQLHAKAEGILAQLKKGADFADLARKESDDKTSAVKGGDVGWLTRGQTVPEFEQVAFTLKPKEISGIVTTQYGFHIIQLMDRQNAHIRTFEEVKPELFAEAQKETGDKLLATAMSTARAELVKSPAQAEAIAKRNNLKFFSVDKIVPGTPLPSVGSRPEVNDAFLSTPKGGVSAVVNLENTGQAAIVVVTDIVASHQADFAEASADVLDRYVAAESANLFRQAAKDAVQKLQKGESLEAVAKLYNAKVETAAPFTQTGSAEGIGPAKNLAEGFTKKSGDAFGPVYISGNAFVCKVTDVIPADMAKFAADRTHIIEILQREKTQAQDTVFRDSVLADLKRRGKVKMNEQAIDRIVQSLKA
jgi:peptidyl-prolyl cis-trans isomerase D